MNLHSPLLIVAVPAALLGAASFGLASAVQQRATKQVPTTRTLNPRLLHELVRKPMWMASVVTVVFGLSLQTIALAFGPLVLVQPLLVTTVVFGGTFSAWLGRRRVDRIIIIGALTCAASLSAFLLLARPSGQRAGLSGVATVLVITCLVLLVALSLTAATWFPGEIRVISLALATGIFYGATAGLIKMVAGQFREGGFAAPFLHWSLYVVCVIGPVGFLLSQNTFQQGRLISPALAVITTVDPLVSVVIGVSWLGESIVATPPALAGETVSAVVLIASIIVLTQRGEQLRRAAEHRRDNGGPSESTWG